MSEITSRGANVQSGIRIEVLTVLWMIVEAAVSIGAGLLARSALLAAFGIDSLIELVSGAILLWRLRIEGQGTDVERVERAERQAAWVVGIALALLCLYVLLTALYSLLTGREFTRRDSDYYRSSGGNALVCDDETAYCREHPQRRFAG